MKAFLAAIFGVVALSATLAAADESLTTIAVPGPNSIVSSQWVQLDAEGNVTGAVLAPNGNRAIAGGEIALTGIGGSFTAPVDARGQFTLADVKPGVYALSFAADDLFATYAMQVVAAREGNLLPTSTTVIASTLSPNRARSTIARYLPHRVEREVSVAGEGQLSLAKPAGQLKGYYQVGQNSTGGLDGRLIQAGSVPEGLVPAAKVNVLVIQDGEVMAQTASAADGTFAIQKLAPGQYNLLASGTDGFAAIGFELVESAEPLAARTDENPFRLASAVMQGPGASLELQLAPPAVDLVGPPGVAVGEPGPPVGPPPFAPGGGFAGGGFGGGGGGFGGGGGGGGLGGGGLRGLAVLGGIGAAIAIAASQDDDDDRPRRASPGRPSFTPPGPPAGVPPGPPDFVTGDDD